MGPRSGDGAPACSVLGWSCPADPCGRAGRTHARAISAARMAYKALWALQKGDGPQTDLGGSLEPAGYLEGGGTVCPEGQGPLAQVAGHPETASGSWRLSGAGMGLAHWLGAERVGDLSIRLGCTFQNPLSVWDRSDPESG